MDQADGWVAEFIGMGAKIVQGDCDGLDTQIYADRRNFYKVEKWSKDGQRVLELLFASLDKARRIFERTIKHGPCIRLTIRQRMSVLDQWPKG